MSGHMIRNAVYALSLVFLLTAPTSGRADGAGLTVVELFTSQGCSSCPPADELLGELATRPDVLALSFHVDYWDYIGWKDSFALPGNTDRQRAYAKRFGRSYVYTPQMVIDGAAETTGRNASDVRRLINDGQTATRVPVSLIATAGGGMKVTLGADSAVDLADVWVVFFDYEASMEITRGENTGRKMRYSNVVRQMKKVSTWSGEATEFSLSGDDMPGETCAVIVQMRDTGRIVGASRLAANPS